MKTPADGSAGDQGKKQGTDALEAYCVNLNEKAKSGRIDPLIGREAEVQPHHPDSLPPAEEQSAFVGDPGVGKTAIAEGLARRIVKGEVPEVLRGCTILPARHGCVDCGHALPRRFRGAHEGGREGNRGHQGAILFIDEIHTVIGAGATSGGAMDASNLLKPALAGGALRCIGSTTYKEYRQHFEKDRALVRRFQKIDVNDHHRRAMEDPERTEALLRRVPQGPLHG